MEDPLYLKFLKIYYICVFTTTWVKFFLSCNIVSTDPSIMLFVICDDILF